MIFNPTSEELDKLYAIYEVNIRRIIDLDIKMRELRPNEPPPEDPKDFEKWLESGSKEWREAREERAELFSHYGRGYI